MAGHTMLKLYTSHNTVLVGHLQSILANAGINCWIRNQSLAGGIGELPPTACWPELWLHDAADRDQALALIKPILAPSPVRHSPWHCDCGEDLEGQFELCWHCGRPRPV